MKKLLVALLLVAACGGGAKASPASESLNQMCVREFGAIYEKHSLPTTNPASERPVACDKFIAEHGITTKVELEIAVRQAEQTLTALDS